MPAAPPPHPVHARARAYFEDFAAAYDDAAAEAGWVANDLLVGELPPVPAVRDAVDLACGTGHTLAVLRSAYRDAVLTGVDIAGAMLDRARRRVPDAHLVRADLGTFLACPPDPVDLVTAVGGLEFVVGLPEVLAGVRRLVRPGGHVVLTYEPLIEGWTPQASRRETNLASNGMDLTTVRWEPHEIAAGFSGWQVVSSRLVAAYVREGVPTVYGWLHYRRPGRPPAVDAVGAD